MADAAQKITFIHLSDIHFIRDFSGQSAYDIDQFVRNELVRDARRLLQHVGEVTGLLVAGDIAFAGKAGEYETALTWLSELSEAVNCPPSLVWSVPGNHDVDRSVLKEHTSIQATHQQIRNHENLDLILKQHLQSGDSALLFSPLRAYNESFASRLGCVTTPQNPWWEDDLELNDGSTLRIRGLNSAMISGATDHRDTCKLCLGSAQTEYMRAEKVTYLTLCHHPPDWLIDGDNVRQALRAYSKIQLLGHKHSHDIEEVNGTLWLYSGAVHPVREEKNWNPTYYVISVSVEGTGQARRLKVEVHRRVWSQTERAFVRPAGQEADCVPYLLPLQAWTAPAADVTKSEPMSTVSRGTAMTVNRKKLLYAFVGLPYHVRLSIMRKLGLIDEINEKLPDSELFASCFDRAVGKGLLDQIWEAVETQTKSRTA
jgi:predicted phosphodiesterase